MQAKMRPFRIMCSSEAVLDKESVGVLAIPKPASLHVRGCMAHLHHDVELVVCPPTGDSPRTVLAFLVVGEEEVQDLIDGHLIGHTSMIDGWEQ